MISKNFFLILIYLLLISCGFSPIYNQNKNLNFWIEIDQVEGDETLNNYIKLNLQRYLLAKSNSNKIVISIDSDYTKNTIAKNMSGISTEYEIIGNFEFDIHFNSQLKKMKFTEKLNVKNLNNTFDEITYEKSNLNNFASSVTQKLILELIRLNDY